jgi:hypothetical protein
MAFFTLLLTAGAQNQRTYETARISGKVPVIDGLLKDAAWDDVPWGEQFTQHEPFDNKPPSQNTRFKILFDDDNVYVAIQALDSIPSAIVDRMTRRDNSDADWVGVIFDSYDDNLTGFGFAVTASGVKFDLMITNDGQDDETWDALWIGKANIDSEGWTAEFRIPLSQLRFARKEEMTWGMNIFRYVYRKQELSLWQPIARNAPGFVSFFGDLKGLKGIHPRKDIEILPYVVGKTEQNEVEAGDPFSRKSRNTGSVGVDGKIAVTNDMTLNFTINPDFGQVEADPSVVNLTAFESYFSEKRPFFIEGKNIFNYRLTGGDDEGTLNMLFYSRRIGRPPHHYPDLGDQEYADVPVNTHILGSFKLSGKTRNGLSVGIQESIAKRERADIDKAGARSKMDVEPMTNYVVARVQKDYNKGISSLGGMITATNRTIREDQLNYLPTSAYAAGLDFSHTWKNKTYYYTIKGLVTRLGGDEKAITEIQRSSAHYYQCPDKDYVKLDSSRTSLSGFAGTFEIGKQGNGKISYMAWLTMRSPGVDFNDLGYMRNADEIQQVFWVGYRQFDSTRYFRSYNINFNEYVGYNFGGTALYKGVNINAHGQLHNYWNLNAGFNLDGESLDLSQLRGGPGLRTPGGINARTFISSDQRKKFTLELNLWIYKGFHDYTTNQGVYFGGTFKPLKSLSISLYPNFSYGYNCDGLIILDRNLLTLKFLNHEKIKKNI